MSNELFKRAEKMIGESQFRDAESVELSKTPEDWYSTIQRTLTGAMLNFDVEQTRKALRNFAGFAGTERAVRYYLYLDDKIFDFIPGEVRTELFGE